MKRPLAPFAVVWSIILFCLAIGPAMPAFGQNTPADSEASLPNIVIIFTDDQGYSDVGSFGAKGFQTPRLDDMAKQGRRFTNFYVAQPVCTASRAALMTGCYSNRIGMAGALNHTSDVGIHEDELLLSELCRRQGYSTAIFGKWHLGHRAKFHPFRHGFDEFFGIPYSNDNGKFHPVLKDIPPLPLIDGVKVVAEEPDQSQLTRQFTERAVSFIERNKDRRFFLYVPHVMPHVPIFASTEFKGKSKAGLYGDVIQEIDWSVGKILDALDKNHLSERTLVIFASDNGPFLSYGEHAGSARPHREGKLTTFEGGVRVPCIMRWPGRIPADTTCNELTSTIDLMPTVAKLIHGKLSDNLIDGIDIRPLIFGRHDAQNLREAFYYYSGDELHAVRSGPWKLHFPHTYLTIASTPGKGGKPSNFDKLTPANIQQSGIEGIATRHGYRIEKLGLSLFNLEDDPGEMNDVSKQHPQVVRQLEQLAEKARHDLGDSLTGRVGKNIRPAGKNP